VFKKRTIVISIFLVMFVFVWIAKSAITKDKTATKTTAKPVTNAAPKVTTQKLALKTPVNQTSKSAAKTPAKSTNTEATAQALFTQAEKFKADRELLKAKELYTKISEDYSNFDKIDEVQNELENTNMQLILSNLQVPNKTVTYTIESGDTLGKLAQKYGTTVELIKLNNNIKGDVIRLGQKLRVWTGKFNIFVDKSQNILILKDGEEVVKTYHVSTGENNSTPVGQFKVISRLVDPVWFNKGAVVPPASPENVLGTRWMGFDIPGYGIHGTVEPDKIGQQVTAGCVRMRNQEVEELFNLIPMGTPVSITD
jgi:lipoprotein-anchoring transpeptidase ErfK/SrfK